MLDPITLDQLRMFIAIAEQGRFSAAATPCPTSSPSWG
jgi:DNA-binding transcriptional LysR family regulator